MSDLASQIEKSVQDDRAIGDSVLASDAFQEAEIASNEYEPDEDTLMTALRNQDDIPILMDIVAEKLVSSVSQEAQFSEAMESFDATQDEVIPVLLQEEQAKPQAPADTTQQDNEASDRRALITQAMTTVLEKRLPDLVQEVLQAMDELSAQKK